MLHFESMLSRGHKDSGLSFYLSFWNLILLTTEQQPDLHLLLPKLYMNSSIFLPAWGPPVRQGPLKGVMWTI